MLGLQSGASTSLQPAHKSIWKTTKKETDTKPFAANVPYVEISRCTGSFLNWQESRGKRRGIEEYCSDPRMAWGCSRERKTLWNFRDNPLKPSVSGRQNAGPNTGKEYWSEFVRFQVEYLERYASVSGRIQMMTFYQFSF